MMSFRSVHAHGGYQYLLRSVATNDADIGNQSLHDYYQAKGTPQGKWIGSGLNAFNSERIMTGKTVTEDQMAALYGEGYHPDTDMLTQQGVDFDACKLGREYPIYTKGEAVIAAITKEERELRTAYNRRLTEEERSEIAIRIGRQMNPDADGMTDKSILRWVNERRDNLRQAVSGYDLTFSPVKSISAVWALADETTASKIAQLHHEAVAETLAEIEANVLYTRKGKAGIEQIKTTGMIASEFTHFDTRTGDPDLHSHVLLANKVLGEDGKWRSVDGQPLYQFITASGQRYNRLLQQKLEETFDMRFVANEKAPGKSPVWEIDGVDQQLLDLWSKRRAASRPIYDSLVKEYVAIHGKSPDKKLADQFWQQAILETRDKKRPAESLADLRTSWRNEATAALGEGAIEGIMINVLFNKTMQKPESFHLEEQADDVAKECLNLALSRRSMVQRNHIETALHQVLHRYHFDSQADLIHAYDHILQRIYDGHLLNVTPDEALYLPEELLNEHGYGIDKRAHSDIYTTAEQLRREESILKAARSPIVLFASEADIQTALATYEQDHGFALNEGQQALARYLLNAGTSVAVGVGPAGTGKTTAMKLVVDVWQQQDRKVLGLAPSAAAASILAEDIGVECNTVDSLTFKWNTLLDQGFMPEQIIAERKIDLGRGDMILVDEAGMLATDRLATLVDIAEHAGAVIRMVGDPYQLDAVETGGMFRTLTNQPGTPVLDQVMRMRYRNEDGSIVVDDAQAQASLQVRDGNADGLALYKQRGWISHGDHETMITTAVGNYLADIEQGKTSVVVASTNADVRIMNEMIQRHHIETGRVQETAGRLLADGLTAFIGDTIVARKNMLLGDMNSKNATRILNGQLLTVVGITKDNDIVARDHTTKALITLPQDYVTNHVQLGYALTTHRCQGATVDTSHLLVDSSTNRNGLYVGLTRGKQANRIYGVLGADIDFDAEQVHYHSYGREPGKTIDDLLDFVIHRDGSQRSAMDTISQYLQEATSDDRLYALYLEGAERATRMAASSIVDDFMMGMQARDQEKLESNHGDGKQALTNVTVMLLQAGINPRPHLQWAYQNTETAKNLGRVMHARISRELADSLADARVEDSEGRWLPQPPAPTVGADGELLAWLRDTYEHFSKPPQQLQPAPILEQGVTYEGMDFSHMDFSGQNLDGVRLKNCNFEGAKFAGTVFANVQIRDCDLRGADFRDASLLQTSMSRSNLEESTFTGAILGQPTQGIRLTDCNMARTDFTDGVFGRAILTRTSLVKANLHNAALSKKFVIDTCDLTDIAVDETTRVEKISVFNECPGSEALPIGFSVNLSEQDSDDGLDDQSTDAALNSMTDHLNLNNHSSHGLEL